MFWKEIVDENDCFEKFNRQKSIHDSWDKIDSFLDIAMSPMSEIKFYRTNPSVIGLDDYFHLKILNSFFG